MIRVLQVLNSMGCGGAENMIMNLYRKIDKTKVQFDFLVHTEKKCFFDDEILQLGGNIYKVPYFNGMNLIEYERALDSFFSKHPEIKIVHGHLGSCANIYLRIAKKYGIYTIAHSHNTNPKKITLKNMAYRLFNLQTRKVADFFFGCSEAAGRDRFGEKIFKSEKFLTLNNAIETDAYKFDEKERDRIRAELGIKDKFVVGHVGRFSEQKNHNYLLDIFKCISDKKEDAVLMLVGGGSLEPKIRKKVEMLGLKDKVIFTGVRSDVNLLLQAMDCFVFPSFFEGLPVTIVEAQAAGLSCFISDTITKEVCISDLVKMLSINADPEIWSRAVLECIPERSSIKDEIIKAGYDINATTAWLTEFYINCCK